MLIEEHTQDTLGFIPAPRTCPGGRLGRGRPGPVCSGTVSRQRTPRDSSVPTATVGRTHHWWTALCQRRPWRERPAARHGHPPSPPDGRHTNGKWQQSYIVGSVHTRARTHTHTRVVERYKRWQCGRVVTHEVLICTWPQTSLFVWKEDLISKSLRSPVKERSKISTSSRHKQEPDERSAKKK